MKDAPIKQFAAGAPETAATELSTPHFDEIAVAIAQPVEPIAPKHDWFAILSTPSMMVAVLLVAGLFGTTALALTLQLRRESRVDTVAPEVQREESTAQPESPLGANIELEKTLRLPTKLRKIRSRAIPAPTQPVARRVGVIKVKRPSVIKLNKLALHSKPSRFWDALFVLYNARRSIPAQL